MKRAFRPAAWLLVLLLVTGLLQACAFGKSSYSGKASTGKAEKIDYETLDVEEEDSYDTRDEVCAYLVQFHHLPSNYMTKKQARKEGWEGGALSNLLPGKSIGGDVFGNYEELLPAGEDRVYHECDIDTIGRSGRGAKRIIFSGDDEEGDWNIYYTDDHYESFIHLWGDDEYE